MAVQPQCSLVQRPLLLLQATMLLFLLICPLVLVKKVPIVRPREPHHIAVEARRYGSNAKDCRVSESFRHQTMDRGKPIAQ